MYNPFEQIQEQLTTIEGKINQILTSPTSEGSASEIIDRKELCKRLAITEPTAIRWEKKGKIPCFHIGSSVRYNWPAVIEALEQKQKG